MAREGFLSGCAGQQAIKPPPDFREYRPRAAAIDSAVIPPPFCLIQQDRTAVNQPLALPVAVVFVPFVKLGTVATQKRAKRGSGAGLLDQGGCGRFALTNKAWLDTMTDPPGMAGFVVSGHGYTSPAFSRKARSVCTFQALTLSESFTGAGNFPVFMSAYSFDLLTG
jgi:hypothetical protein